MKRFFILLILLRYNSGYQIPIYYDFSEQAEQAFTIDNLDFICPMIIKYFFWLMGVNHPTTIVW